MKPQGESQFHRRANLQNLPNMTVNTSAAMYDWQTAQHHAEHRRREIGDLLRFESALPLQKRALRNHRRIAPGLWHEPGLLYGEDANLNGMLDPNENDGMKLPPYDNQDGILDPGLFEYVTVLSHETTHGTNGIGARRGH